MGSDADRLGYDPSEIPELQGIDPATLPELTPEEKAIVDEMVAKNDEGEPRVDLHDSEIMQVTAIMLELQAKYQFRPATHANLTSMAHEAEEKFREIGLGILVDWIGPALRNEPPCITIRTRLTPFDSERQQFEVRRGVADPYFKAAEKEYKKGNTG